MNTARRLKAPASERIPFVENMLRLLPRIYISATDLQLNQFLAEDAYLEGRLDEDFYDSVRRGVENLLGPDDTYLEVFEEGHEIFRHAYSGVGVGRSCRYLSSDVQSA